MNLDRLKDTALGVLVVAIIATGVLALLFGGGASALILITGIIGGLALQVLLLATVADATVQTLKKEK